MRTRETTSQRVVALLHCPHMRTSAGEGEDRGATREAGDEDEFIVMGVLDCSNSASRTRRIEKKLVTRSKLVIISWLLSLCRANNFLALYHT